MNYANSAELREQIRATWDGVGLVSFSCGKDALCTWLAHRESGFREVHAVYLYLVPDLEFVEESIQLYEKRFGTKIHRLPHPSFCRLMRERVFQPPERWRPVGKLNLPNLTYDDVEMAARHAAGIDRRVPVAHGSRAADSLNRRTAVKRFGAVNKNRNTYWAIYDWTIADVRSCLARHKRTRGEVRFAPSASATPFAACLSAAAFLGGHLCCFALSHGVPPFSLRPLERPQVHPPPHQAPAGPWLRPRPSWPSGAARRPR